MEREEAMSTLQEGYLLIADITGYTLYLSESELEHAEQTLTALLEILVEHTRPPLIISRLEGDAVISYGLHENFFKGQTFIELIENTYVAFRKTIERLVLNTTCKCKACANISSLDMKFFIHYGTFAIQHIGRHDELVGSDVNLIHRLLKNRVHEMTGFRAYTLCTDAAVRQLGLEEMTDTMQPHTERVEHLGDVKVWVQDMHPVWEGKRATSQVTIPPNQIISQGEIEIGMSPERLWDYLTQPDFRNTLVMSDRQEILNRENGRIVPGSVYQCYHGDKIIPQTILEWQPFKRIVIQQRMAIPIPDTTILSESRLVPTETGTCLIQSASKAKGPLFGRLLVRLMLPMMAKNLENATLRFKQQIENDLASKRNG
jgi:uncharacterized protein YndB with AHSA1/START domain